MNKIVVGSTANLALTEHNVNPNSPASYSGQVTRWQCGCISATNGYRRLCPDHTELPPVVRLVEEPVKVDAIGNASLAQWAQNAVLACDTNHLKRIRRRVEDALRKGGDGQILRCAEILGVSLT